MPVPAARAGAAPFLVGLSAGLALGVAAAFLVPRALRRRREAVAAGAGATLDRRRKSGRPPPRREVIVGDALAWIRAQAEFPSHACIVTGVPDVVEAAPGASPMPMEQYRVWFEDVAESILSRLAAGSRAIFVQTDTKLEDVPGSYAEWIDKSFLLQRAADRVDGVVLLWHKIASFDAVGGNSSRSGGMMKTRYSHMLCFGRAPCSEKHLGPVASVPDVLRRGHVTWARGIGLRCCLAVCRYAKKCGFTTVIDPFCGEGMVIAVAAHCGLESIGVELSRKRAEAARKLEVKELVARDAMEEVG